MPDLNELWTEFLTTWPPDRVRRMTLEEYTNLNRDDAFVYWLEKHLESLGSIWGGSAFKFGIYRRDREKTEVKEPSGGRIWGEKYAWMAKYGETELEAFSTVRSRLVEVIEAAKASNLEAIDEVEFSPAVKWKTAFLYQDRGNPRIIGIYKKDWLFFHYRKVDPSAKLKDVPFSVLHTTLIDRYEDIGDVFDIGTKIWKEVEAAKTTQPRYWAVPLGWALPDAAVAEALCSKEVVTSEDVDPALDRILAEAEIAESDRIAFLIGETVRVLAEVTNAEAGDFAWTQKSIQSSLSLIPPVTTGVRELSKEEVASIWGKPSKETPAKAEPQAWKIAPGAGAGLWQAWRTDGYASIGWPLVGDLTGIDREAFEERVQAAHAEDPEGYKAQGIEQVWEFLQIPVGSRLVANRGKTHVVGFGTVTGPYFYSPGEGHPHRLPVRWDWTGHFALAEPRHDWQVTLRHLDESDFVELEASVGPAAPSRPRNIVLYGPPGTGKTYSTVSRALELVLDEAKVRAMSTDTKARQFRRLQQEGRIEFVTFHQAYGYEEFVEGIRPVLGSGEGHEIQYELHDGVFKRIARRATAEGLKSPRPDEPSFNVLWRQLVESVASEEDRVVESYTGKTYVLRKTARGNLETVLCDVDEEGALVSVSETRQIASKANVELVWSHRHELGLEPKEVTAPKTVRLFSRDRGGGGGHHYTAIWIVYKELLSLSRAAERRPPAARVLLERVQETLDKPTSGAADFRFTATTPQYVLVIDEINRGNVSKILGELITLLEPDKRLGTSGELKLPLSYSPEHKFAVPPNLHLLGTMNTADRSIALMDVALRRRFTFEEMMPDTVVLREVLGGHVEDSTFIDLVVDLMETMNRRIRFLYDRDHQLGHSYFLEVRGYEDLRQVFVDRLVPLLQEYFYGAWDKICTVVGCPVDETGKPQRTGPTVSGGAYVAPIVLAEVFAEEATLGFDHDDYEDRLDFRVDPGFALPSKGFDSLLSYFLGILDLDAAAFEQRRKTLESGALLANEETSETP